MPTARGLAFRQRCGWQDLRHWRVAQGTGAWVNTILTVEVYDPCHGHLDPEGRHARVKTCWFHQRVMDGKIYGFGGYQSRLRVDEYDPVTDTWTEKDTTRTNIIGLSTSVLDGKIYVIGGYVPPGGPNYPGVTTMEVYNPATGSWTEGPDMPTGRWGLRTCVVDGKIYAIGGVTLWLEKNACGTVEVYTE